MTAQKMAVHAQLAVNLSDMLAACQPDPKKLPQVIEAAHRLYVRTMSYKRYHQNPQYRAEAIQKATLRVQQRRLDPAYRAHEADLQRARRARKRAAQAVGYQPIAV